MGIKIERVRAYVREHRRRTLIENTVRGRAERHRAGDGFVAGLQTGGKYRCVQRSRTRTEADCVLCSNPGREPLFELPHLRTRGEPVRFQNVNRGLDIFLVQALAAVWQQRLPYR